MLLSVSSTPFLANCTKGDKVCLLLYTDEATLSLVLEEEEDGRLALLKKVCMSKYTDFLSRGGSSNQGIVVAEE